MLRALQRSIFGRRCGASLRSISVQRTPRRPRSSARVSPTGPAPTIRTWVSMRGGNPSQTRQSAICFGSSHSKFAVRDIGGAGMTDWIGRLWRGEIGLARAFWEYAIVFGTLIHLVTTGVAYGAFVAGAPLWLAAVIFFLAAPYTVSGHGRGVAQRGALSGPGEMGACRADRRGGLGDCVAVSCS